MASAEPLYRQIYDDLKAAIEDGTYTEGNKIPSEQELSQSYEVSRITVRKAVEELCSAGYLTKKRGLGTFVNPPRIHRMMSARDFMRFTDICTEYGTVAGAKLIERQIVPIRADEMDFFGLDEDALLIYYQRVRTADGMPIYEENIFLPYPEFHEIMSVPLDDISTFEVIESISGRKVRHARRRQIEAISATSERASLLQTPVNSPLLHANYYFEDLDGRPLCIGRQYYVGSRYMLEM